jgi:hypothetical protein
VLRLAAAREGLDDDHAAAAARAWVGRLVCRRGAIGSLLLLRCLRRFRRSDQLTRPRDGIRSGDLGRMLMDPKQDRQMRSRGAALSGNLVITAVKVTFGVSENEVSQTTFPVFLVGRDDARRVAETTGAGARAAAERHRIGAFRRLRAATATTSRT